jgi:hypothetical protein
VKSFLKVFFLCLLVQTGYASSDCSHAQLFKELKKIADVGYLHNCSLSIAILGEEDTRVDSVSIFLEASDLYLCQFAESCPTTREYFSLSKSCLTSENSSVIEDQKFQYLIGYELGLKKITRGIQLRLNYNNQVQLLELMHRNLVTGEYLTHVRCSPEN